MNYKTAAIGGVAVVVALAITVFNRTEVHPAQQEDRQPAPVVQPVADLTPPPQPLPVRSVTESEPAQATEVIELPKQFESYADLTRALEQMGGCEIAGGEVGEFIDSWNEQWRENMQDFAAVFNTLPSSDAYQSYSEETLHSLAQSNDDRAQIILAHKAMADKRMEEAKAAYSRAAMLGSVDAPHYILWILSDEKRVAMEQNNIARVIELTTEMLAWHQVLEKRAGVMYHPPSERQAWAYVEEDEFLRQQAAQKGQKLYAEMNQERLALGLDEFQNLPQSLDLDAVVEHIDCTPKP